MTDDFVPRRAIEDDPVDAPDAATTGVPTPGVPATGVPGTAGKRTERPHPLTPFIRGWVVLLAAIIAFGREFVSFDPNRRLPPVPWIVLGVAGVALIAAVAGYITWRFTRFVIDSEELRIETGALFRRSTRVAFDKVQSIDVVQPLAARLFGLAELQIDVGSHERFKVRYLSLARAYALRDYLLARARGSQAELAETARSTSVLTDLNEADEVLIKVPPQTLLLAAVTSHEFWGIVLGGVALAVAGLATGQWWLLLAAAVPTISGLFGFVTRRVTGQFNYTLSRRAHGLRISRGLTSLTSQSLPARRIQAVQLSQSPVWRRLGLYRIDIEVIGWGAVTEDEDKSGVSSILLPAGTMEQVQVALAAIWPRVDFTTVPLEGAPKRARWLHPFSQPFLRWGHDDQLVVSRHGWLVRRWQLVPLARVQSVRIEQGPVSRRLRLADLAFDTAGGHIDVHASGLDAGPLSARQTELLQLVRHHVGPDVSDPVVPDAPTEPPADPQTEGPDALRADQADETISSTE
ncbi:MAG: PH domain-containing protein [Actinobacteria bacterium]|nr:PH domain-containing protein [Actinomycetota bacterium]